MEPTLSIAMTNLKALAEEAGLLVTLEDNDSGDVLQSFTLVVQRQQVAEPTNMLEVVSNAERLTVHSCRTFNEGRWSHSFRRLGYAGLNDTLPLKYAAGYIRRMAQET